MASDLRNHISKRVKIAACLLSLAILSSCGVTGPIYSQPDPDPAKTVAFVENKKPGTMAHFTSYAVGQVNGMSMGRFRTRLPDGTRAWTAHAGRQRLTLSMYHSSPPWETGSLQAMGDISINLKPGKVYEVDGKIHSTHLIDLWLRERETQKRVSEVVSVVPTTLRQTPPVIFVPGN